MRHALTKEHFDFYYRHHYIEFENLLTPEEVETLETAIDDTFIKRLGKTPNAKEGYLAGYDGWRDDPRIKKVVLNSQLAEIASNLSKVRPLRLAFDQMLVGSKESGKIFDHPFTLEELSSMQPAPCALLLQLSPTATEQEDLPKKPGNGMFFSPRHLFSFDYLSETPHLSQLLIVYAADRAIYKHTPTDPHTHVYKKLGYAFGDRPNTTTHPIVYNP